MSFKKLVSDKYGCNLINEKQILAGIKTRNFGRIVHSFDLIDSTNTYARSLSKEKGSHGTVVLAEEQSAGRGRLQRTWNAEKGKNLLFSLVLYPEFGFEKISLLPFAASLAVADAIDAVTGLSSTCKWPNDVMINGRKVCGMLLESVTGGEMIDKVVLGIGMNVNQSTFSDDLRNKATSLSIESGVEVDRIRLLQSVLEECELRYEQLAQFPPMQLLNEWKLKALLFGKKITVLESEFSYNATAIDLAEDGSLIIKLEDGHTKNIFAGDVSLAYT